MNDAQQQTPERQALTEISLICSEALSHGADSAGVVEIIEAISAKAREHLDGSKPAPTAVSKIAILDDDGCILGVGDTEAEARADALKTVESAPRVYLEALVEEMDAHAVSPALAAKAMRDGGDTLVERVRIDGEWLLVTPEEAAEVTAGARP
jgi:hypothetical protein